MDIEDDRERVQRALNDAKKRQLEQRYGGSFHSNCPLPPDVEADWLAHIEEFERQFETAGQTNVRAYCGNPSFRSLAAIAPDELEQELGQALQLLASNNIIVHFKSSVSAAEAYRFITEELMDEELDDIRIDGMTQNFMYEEFHQDEGSDASQCAECFMRQLFMHDRNDLVADMCLAEEADAARFEQDIIAFRHDAAVFIGFDVDAMDCTIADGRATVLLNMSWQGLQAGTLAHFSGAGKGMVRLKRVEEGDWRVFEFAITPADT